MSCQHDRRKKKKINVSRIFIYIKAPKMCIGWPAPVTQIVTPPPPTPTSLVSAPNAATNGRGMVDGYYTPPPSP